MGTALPCLLSIPHGGTHIPEEVAEWVVASERDVLADGDAFTIELYDLGSDVVHCVAGEVARAFVDLNRARHERPPSNPDGVVKSQTVHGIPLYSRPLPATVIDPLLRRYYDPFHDRLETLARDGDALIGVDCHSMLSDPPPGFPNQQKRPAFCVSNDHGKTASARQAEALSDSLRETFELGEGGVQLNDPFAGGHIVRHHAAGGLPWLQLEINRSLYLDPETLQPLATLEATRERLRAALQRFTEAVATSN